MRRARLAGAVAAAAVAGALRARRRRAPEAPDGGWYEPAHRSRATVQRWSRYVEMPDGTRLAIDGFVPGGGPHPTVLVQTRYFRRTAVRGFAAPLERSLDVRRPLTERLLGAGYAVVVADARGSGASFGSRTAEWDANEVADGSALVDWIVEQPWSDGTVVSTGGSYEGSCAEHLARTGNPAVKGVVIRYALFDLYADMVAPGGIKSSWFLPTWAAMNRAKDANVQEAFLLRRGGGRVRWTAPLFAGVPAVDEDVDGSALAAAIAAHAANYDLVEAMDAVEFRDDLRPAGDRLGDYSPHGYLDAARAAAVPVYSWSAWYDGACTEAAVKRFRAFADQGARLILGPWDHGNRQLPDPTTPARTPAFDASGEIIRFFDEALGRRDTGMSAEDPVWFYTVGKGWASAPTWPPPHVQPIDLYPAAGGRLSWEGPHDGADTYRVDPLATTGDSNRWVTLLNLWDRRIGYPDRARRDRRLLVYDTAPLASDLEVTGHPVVSLAVASDATDGAFFAYLEEVTADGEVRYVTEGMLRAIHRRVDPHPPAWFPPVPYHSFLRAHAMPLVPGETAELAFGLQPVSYLFRAGSRVRLAFAGADDGNFVRIGDPSATWTVDRARSRLRLPVAC